MRLGRHPKRAAELQAARVAKMKLGQAFDVLSEIFYLKIDLKL